MKFKNKLTGAVIDVTAPIFGENWIEFETEELVTKDGTETVEVEPVEEPEVEEAEDFDLTKMSIKELKAFAKENVIEIPSEARTKPQIIEIIAKAFEM